MGAKINILHLRSSSGGGGGPEKTILNTGSLIDPTLFSYHIGYLKKKTESLEPIQKIATALGLSYKEFSGKRFFDINQFLKIKQYIYDLQIDILHCHDYKTDIYGVLLKKLGGRFKLVTTLHGWILSKGYKKSYVWLDKAILPLFDLVIAVSIPIETVAHQKGAKNVKLIYNAIDPDKWKPDCYQNSQTVIHNKTPKIGFVGRISKEKGPLDFVKIAKKITTILPSCKFIVAGEGPLTNLMKQMIKEEGLSNNFSLLGQLPQEDIFAVYKTLDVLLSPSYTEGLPNNLLEACAMEVPVVATDVGGVPALIENNVNGLLFKPMDIEGMAQAVIKLLRDRELAIRLRMDGRAKILEKFSFQARVQKLETEYLNLMDVR